MMTRARKRDGSDFGKLLVTVCGDKSGSEVKDTYGRCLLLAKDYRKAKKRRGPSGDAVKEEGQVVDACLQRSCGKTVQVGRTFLNETKTKVAQMQGHVR